MTENSQSRLSLNRTKNKYSIIKYIMKPQEHVIPGVSLLQRHAVINKFMEGYPDVDLDMRVGAEGELLSWLADDTIDLAIGEPTEKAAKIFMRYLHRYAADQPIPLNQD